MRVATQETLGLLAHAVHLGLVLFGLVGVGVLLVPGWRASRAARRAGPAWHPPHTAEEHEQRVAALRASAGAGALGVPPPGPSSSSP